MGSVVGAAYALRGDWYRAVMEFAGAAFPQTPHGLQGGRRRKASRLRRLASGAKTMWDLGRGWGAGEEEIEAGRAALETLLGDADLGDGRVPVAVSATDLLSGDRVVMRKGRAVDAVYASSALAGVLPPRRVGPYLLADGAYTDICPIDVARGFGCERIVAVSPGRSDVVDDIRNGLQGLMRATEICYLHHAALRFEQADIVLHPPFRRAIDTLDFGAHRECVAAGVRAVRANMEELERVLGSQGRAA
jgi:NTE family protein